MCWLQTLELAIHSELYLVFLHYVLFSEAQILSEDIWLLEEYSAELLFAGEEIGVADGSCQQSAVVQLADSVQCLDKL